MVERVGRVEGKVAIVTGAGSTPGPGIGTGKATAVVLAREGASVLLVDLHPERAEQTRQMIEEEGGKARVFGADVTRAAECEAMVRAAVDAFGTVDILVNNIGLASLGTVVDTTEEAWDRAFDINLRTAFLASKYAVPVMAERGAGAIVNVASISALRGDGTVAYSAAKGGLIAMTVDMAYSHGRQGIRVNAVAPGHITTPMVMSVSVPGARAEFMNTMRSEAGLLGTPGTGWDVGWAAAFLASDEARWITGVTLPVESGVLSVTPLMMAPYLRAIPDPPGLVAHPAVSEVAVQLVHADAGSPGAVAPAHRTQMPSGGRVLMEVPDPVSWFDDPFAGPEQSGVLGLVPLVLAFLRGPGVGQADVDSLVQVEPLAVPRRDDRVRRDLRAAAVVPHPAQRRGAAGHLRGADADRRAVLHVAARRVRGMAWDRPGGRRHLRGDAGSLGGDPGCLRGDAGGGGQGAGADVHDDLVDLRVIGGGGLPGQERLGDRQQGVGQGRRTSPRPARRRASPRRRSRPCPGGGAPRRRPPRAAP